MAMNHPQLKEPSFPILPLPLVRQVALDAAVHEKTVRRLVAGLPTRPAGRDRILAALAARGVDMSRIKPRDLPPGEQEPEEGPKLREALATAERHYGLAPLYPEPSKETQR